MTMTMTVIRYVSLHCFDLLKFTKASQKRRRMKATELPPAIRDKMKKAFLECHKAVMACEDETGRRRCELFKDLPDKRVSNFRSSLILSVAKI
jgi:hypothetical protein